jgi:hypothetical protein
MKRIVIGVAAALVVVLVAYVGYGIQQKRALRAQVSEAVNAAGTRLAETLKVDLNTVSPEMAEKLARFSAESDADLEKLRAAGTRPDRELAETADNYLGSAAAVLKRQAGGAKARLKFAESRKALSEHLAKAAQRTDGWSAEAIRLKERLDADYFEYRIAVTSLGNMLGELPAARAKLAVLLPGARLPEEGEVKEARARNSAGAEATRQAFEQAKQLVPR